MSSVDVPTDPHSENGHSEGSVEDRLAALEQQMAEVQEENDQLRDELERKDARIERQSEQIAALESVLDSEIRPRLDGLRKMIDQHDEDLYGGADEKFSDELDEYREDSNGLCYDVLRSLPELLDARVEMREDIDRNSNGRAKNRRRINILAEDAGLDPERALERDKIGALLEGPSEVNEEGVMATERAHDILMNAPRWGTQMGHKGVQCLRLVGPEVTTHLSDLRDESLQSVQVKRAFQKLADLGADSPRVVDHTKNNRTENRVLFLQLDQEEFDRLTE